MPESAALLLAFHNHQPVGNFRSVFETAFADCYAPFLKAVRSRPSFKFTAHYSGPLLEYMREHEPACWDILSELAGRGQVELLGGGFYEPILTTIPEPDRLGQLEMMADFLARHFGRRPRGVWLTERVWEPSLASTLARAGVEYTLLDEEHFHYAGVGDIHAYYITEDEGRLLKVFPIDKRLRYIIPFQGLEQFEAHWEAIRAKGGLAILGDDGEKFGLWPGTKAWVFDGGWLARFLDLLEGKGVRTATYAEILDERPPAGRVFLPPASYEEMMEWVLEPAAAAAFRALKAGTPEADRRFLRGGFFRDFFLKYPESHHLRQRMLLVSREVADAGGEEARRELYKGECNDPLWHGVFGGLYLPHLREASYEHLLKAEALAAPETGWTPLDFDLDGRDEWLRRDRTLGVIVKPAAGGTLIEIDHYPLARNLSDVLSRRPEAYHRGEAEPAPGAGREPGEGKSIHELSKRLPDEARRIRYDRGMRASAADRFFAEGEPALDTPEYADADRGDFRSGAYAAALLGPVLRLARTGEVRTDAGQVPVRIEKDIRPDGEGRLIVEIRVRALADAPTSLVFASEWNLCQFPFEFVVGEGIVRLCGGRVELAFHPVPVLRAWPIETLSQSEKGYDIIHQGFSLLAAWTLALSGREEFRGRITFGDAKPD